MAWLSQMLEVDACIAVAGRDICTERGWVIHQGSVWNIFLELSCFFHDPADVGNVISGSSAFSKTTLNIRKFTVHIYLLEKPAIFVLWNVPYSGVCCLHPGDIL